MDNKKNDVNKTIKNLTNKILELESTIDAMRAELRVAQQERWAKEK